METATAAIRARAKEEAKMKAIEALTDDELASSIEVYIEELAKRDFKRARQLLAHLAIELIDKKLEALGM